MLILPDKPECHYSLPLWLLHQARIKVVIAGINYIHEGESA
jgi:hypothetical protein